MGSTFRVFSTPTILGAANTEGPHSESSSVDISHRGEQRRRSLLRIGESVDVWVHPCDHTNAVLTRSVPLPVLVVCGAPRVFADRIWHMDVHRSGADRRLTTA